MKLPPYIDPFLHLLLIGCRLQLSLVEGIVEGDHDRRDGERKRIPLEAVEVEHKEAKGYSE